MYNFLHTKKRFDIRNYILLRVPLNKCEDAGMLIQKQLQWQLYNLLQVITESRWHSTNCMPPPRQKQIQTL